MTADSFFEGFPLTKVIVLSRDKTDIRYPAYLAEFQAVEDPLRFENLMNYPFSKIKKFKWIGMLEQYQNIL